MDDSRIIELYWNRDSDAIEESGKKYGAYCFSIANNILRSKEDAEECVNDTWLRAWNAIPPQKPAKLQMFLAKITRNLSFDRLRSHSAEKRGGGEIALALDELAECVPCEGGAASELEYQELVKAVRRFVKSLPERDCNVFLRRYFFTESVREIASRYCLSENHVAVILSWVRRKLKQYLLKEGLMDE